MDPISKTSKRKTLGIIVGVLVLFVLVAVIVGSHKTPNTAAANSNTPAATVAPVATSPPTTAVPVSYSTVTLLDKSGYGIAEPPAFTIPTNAKDWYLTWAYTCSNFGEGTGNFIVDINKLSGDGFTSDLGANELGSGGHDQDTYYDTGVFQLQVNSECNWAVIVSVVVPG